MLTSLNIKTPEYESKLRKLLSKLMFDTMSIEVLNVGDIKLKHVEYINRSGRVNWKKIDKEVGAQRNRLLCDKKLQLPKDSGYRRFECKEFMYRLCTNLGISLLFSIENKDINVGLLDIDASFIGLPKYLLRYTDSVVVVTKETDIYMQVGEELLHETGAPMRLSKSPRSLELCDLVIAPKGVQNDVEFKKDAVVLTTKKPDKACDATVVYDYRIELDGLLEKACPQNLSHTYFASALYTMCHMYKLGSLVPTLCVSDNKVHTPSSLKILMQNIVDKNLT